MAIDKALKIDPADVKSKIKSFIRSTLEERDIEGLLIFYRDVLEVIVNVHLAKEIVGDENVKLLVTKGRFIAKQPREEMDLPAVNKYLNLPPENVIFANKGKILQEIREIFSEHIDVRYGFGLETVPALNYNLSYLLLRDMERREIEKKTYAPPSKKPVSKRDKFIQRTIAHHKSQIRLGVLLAFLLAETENRSVIGSPNKTEWSLGLFTKFGNYHACDFLPLAGLYQTQVIQLANYLGLQDYLTSKQLKSPSTYEYFFNIEVDKVDRILIRLESGSMVEEIFEETNIPLESIKKVDYYYKASNYARVVPLIPEL
jgi:NH3-dependent NAD+ synthetase